MCNCTNCDCTECGNQNPEKLTGDAAIAAGKQPWNLEWYCDEDCNCCSK